MWWRCHSKYPIRNNSLFSFTMGKKTAQMPFTLRCDQCIVKSVLQDQECTFWSKKFAHRQESVVDKERPGRHQNNTAARSFLIDTTFLTISKLITPSMYCWFRKTLVTMHWTQFRVNNGIIILEKSILGFFILWKLPKLCCFVTYLWYSPHIKPNVRQTDNITFICMFYWFICMFYWNVQSS